ncbi:MAG TPA: hypothetical protein VLS28_11610, partial [Candidatus Sulfomarinibacteraceae bacterium]|nr:hypothetical protein [Candidatus Sulfomarinibacteraceae bacterium]
LARSSGPDSPQRGAIIARAREETRLEFRCRASRRIGIPNLMRVAASMAARCGHAHQECGGVHIVAASTAARCGHAHQE